MGILFFKWKTPLKKNDTYATTGAQLSNRFSSCIHTCSKFVHVNVSSTVKCLQWTSTGFRTSAVPRCSSPSPTWNRNCVYHRYRASHSSLLVYVKILNLRRRLHFLVRIISTFQTFPELSRKILDCLRHSRLHNVFPLNRRKLDYMVLWKKCYGCYQGSSSSREAWKTFWFFPLIGTRCTMIINKLIKQTIYEVCQNAPIAFLKYPVCMRKTSNHSKRTCHFL